MQMTETATTDKQEILSIGDFDIPPFPEPEAVWKTAAQKADSIDVPGPDYIGDSNRKAWYCPTASIRDAHRALTLLEEYGIETVYDLGAGDCRFSLWLADQGFDVVAYEIIDQLAESVQRNFDTSGLEIRSHDYFEDYDDLISAKAAVIAFGGTNELPYIPDNGLAIEGYSEIGIRAHYEGEMVAAW